VIEPGERHRRTYVQINEAVSSLADKRPPDVSKRQWSFVIGWTMNAVSNCCAVKEFIVDSDRFHQFARELDREVERDVDMATIDWIWDQFEQFSKYGKTYSANWRPTTPERLKESEYTSTGIEVK